MSPFARHEIVAGDDLPVDDQSSAASGPEDHPEDHWLPGTGTIDRLAEREAVRVVRDGDRSVQRTCQIEAQGATVETGGVGVAMKSGLRVR